jgi:hypothetical protein
MKTKAIFKMGILFKKKPLGLFAKLAPKTRTNDFHKK